MKRLVIAIVAALVVQLAPQASLAESQALKLDNPNFDGNLSGWEQLSFPQQNRNVSFEVEKNGWNGSKSARVSSKGKGGGSLVQTIPIEGLSSVRVSGQVKGEIENGFAFIDCAMVGQDQPRPPFPRCEPVMDGKSDWTKVEGVFQVSMGTKAVRISLTVAGDGSAMFDEITVTGEKGQPQFQGNVDVDKNFVPDPGFEEVSSGSFVKWTKLEGTGKLSISTDPYEGKHCARIDNDSDKPFRISTDIVITEGQPPFGMVGHIKAKGVKSAYVTFEIPQKGGGGGRQKPPQDNPKTAPITFGQEEWTRVSGIFGLPRDTTTIRIVCVVEGAGTVWFDDVQAGTLKKPDSGRQSGAFDEYWVENPLSKVKLATHVFKPQKFDENKRYPAIFMLPGGNGYGTQLERGGLPAKLANETGAIITVFDPDGRGLTKEGTDDISGEIHQSGFNAVVKHVSDLKYVDRANIGFYTMSFGIILGACTAGRYVDDPPIKFIIDWEGPDGHLCPTNHVGRYDMEFWAPREASDWIRKYPGAYVRLQSERDHAQKTNDHALRMINAATNKAFGGDGKTVFSRVNMKEGEFSNPPNIAYRDGNEPVWIPDSQDRRMDEHIVGLLRELIEMKPEFAAPQKPAKSAVKGRNRLGFLNPYGYPKYSKEFTKKYFDALAVKNEDEFHARVSQELEPLGPTVSRVDFFLWAGDEWRQKLASLKLKTWEEVRFLATLNFRDPGDPIEIGKKVAQVVEYYDGDGEGDNPFGVVIKDWQIENEVNMKELFWKGTPGQYASHLENCAKAAKTADPECRIVLAGEACDVASDTYPKILKALDHRQVFDAVDIHVYSDSKERDAVAKHAKRFKGYLKDAGFENDIPMWMTEFGVTTGKARSLTSNDENVQASTFAIRAIQAAALSFEGSCYISLVDLYPDALNRDIFDRMGLVSSGMATKDRAWTKRKTYWTYLRLSEMMSMVSFENVEKVAMFGESIATYKFSRPGLEPIVFAYIDKPDTLPKEKPNLFTSPFTYYPIVAGSPAESADWNKGHTVIPGDRSMAAKFVEDLLGGPVAIVMGETSSIASRFGVFDTVMQTCLDETSCSPYYTDEAIRELGTNWMLMRPRLDFLTDEKAWVHNDVIVSDMARRGIEPVIDLSAFPGLDGARLTDASRQIAERYDSDGLKDAFGSFTANRFRLAPSASQTPEDFAGLIPEINRALKSANRNAILIVGGDNPDSWWKEVFANIPQVAAKEKKAFDLFDLAAFASVAGDQTRNHKALLNSIDGSKKLLDDARLGNVGIAVMQVGTHSGSADGKPDQTEKEQASELAKLYAISCASRASIVGLGGKFGEGCSLFKADGSRKLGYFTLSKLSQALSTAKNTGKIIPGDEDFGARFFERTTDGLWVTRFGLGPNSVAIGWIDADKPPMFSSQDYGLPFSSAIELEYLIPEEPVKGAPVFKKLMIGGQNGKFTIPTDRLDPFIIRPTGEMIEPLTVALNPPELALDPGQTGIVKVRVMGCKGKVELSFPSTKTLPIEAQSKEPDENGDFMLRVSTDSSNRGKSVTVKITAICENGEQATAELTVNVSSQSTIKITLWVGKNTALINGKETALAVPPTIVGGKTLVPVRFISEAFGAKVVWDQKEQRIELFFGLLDDGSYTKKVTLWIGKKTAQADYGSKLPAYREYSLDVAPTIMSGTTMVPIRFLSDVLGAKTLWDGAEKRIDITWTPF